MNLRPRFFVLNTLIILFGFIFTLGVFFKIAGETVEKWGLALAEKQLLYDKTRAVQYIIREITISRQMSVSEDVVNWAKNQRDPKYTSAGVEAMENFRREFTAGNYFIAFLDTGSYHYNNSTTPDNKNTYKYTLNPDNPSDNWFYSIIKEGKDYHLNVNPDYYLGVTKLWIDVLLKDKNGEILGVLGTGLDLDDFISRFTENAGNGISSLFMDHNGAIQVYFDKSKIDFSTISKQEGEHHSVYAVFETEADNRFVRDAMESLLKDKSDKVESRFVKIGKKRMLCCISYIAELDWYEIAFFDVNTLFSEKDLAGIAVAFVLTLLLSIVIYYFALDRFVIRPVRRLDDAVGVMKGGDFRKLNGLKDEDGEMGRLTEHFKEMASSVQEMTETLENRVMERTEALNRLVRIDPMTEVLNRRGMTEIVESEMKRAVRTKSRLGVLWVDIDHFKEINDTYGHGLGDVTIIKAANVLKHAVRQYDYVARWGGDEFIVLLTDCSPETLAISSARIKELMDNAVVYDEKSGARFGIKISIGGYMACDGEDTDTIFNKADKALYKAKEKGRNCIVISD